MIPGLPQVGAPELIILLSIILLLFGAKRIPELARSLGRGKREFHKGASEDADAQEVKEARDAIKDLRSEALYGAQRDKHPGG
jgi:sec-independent protein translocase protein TatA